jgi:hypothetical protein
VLGEVGDEAAVDLQRGDREVPEVGQRAVAGAEVVHRDADAVLAQAAQQPDRRLGVLHDRRLGDLKDQLAGR